MRATGKLSQVVHHLGPIALGLVTACVVTGCEGCLGLDDYDLVPPGSIDIGGNGPGQGGGPTTPAECNAAPSGTVYVSRHVLAGEFPEESCGAPYAESDVIDILALSPLDGSCLAHARMELTGGASLGSRIRVTHAASDDSPVAVAGTFQGGTLSFPPLCGAGDGAALLVTAEPGSTHSAFVSLLREDGATFCTDWVRRGWTTNGSPIEIFDLETTGDTVALSGRASAPGLSFFDAGTHTATTEGVAIHVEFDINGQLTSAYAFGKGEADAATSTAFVDDDALVTGSLFQSDAACAGCAGESHVVDAGANCSSAAGGAGGSGASAGGAGNDGIGGAEGSGGSDLGSGGSAGGGLVEAGGGGAGSVVPPDSQNAWLWQRTAGDSSCEGFTTFGSDSGGPADAQVALDIAARRFGAECQTYFAGLAGQAAWPWQKADALSALFTPPGDTLDAFLIASRGTTCGVDAVYQWSTRFMPASVNGAAWVNRVEALGCETGAVATLLVSGDAASLRATTCDAQRHCGQDVNLILPGGGNQMVIASVSALGAVRWHGSLGPVEHTGYPAGAIQLPAPIDHLATDKRDGSYMVFRSIGPLLTNNLDLSPCPALEGSPAPGTFVMALAQSGNNGRAVCAWAKRF